MDPFDIAEVVEKKKVDDVEGMASSVAYGAGLKKGDVVVAMCVPAPDTSAARALFLWPCLLLCPRAGWPRLYSTAQQICMCGRDVS